jgi:crossover junction endodeoxyribonuclease RusA
MNERIYTLPFPPSLNRLYRAVAGRVVLSETARKWKLEAFNAMPLGAVPAPLTGRLIVDMNLIAPAALTNKDWDICNREKLMCDFLTDQRVWLDDSQIDEMTIRREAPHADFPKGVVDIFIREY